jgi:hypothetical protein
MEKIPECIQGHTYFIARMLLECCSNETNNKTRQHDKDVVWFSQVCIYNTRRFTAWKRRHTTGIQEERIYTKEVIKQQTISTAAACTTDERPERSYVLGHVADMVMNNVSVIDPERDT